MRVECKHRRVGESPIPRGMGILPMRGGALLALPRIGFWHGQDARGTHGRDAHAPCRTASKTYPFFFALTLLLAGGTARSAQPAARPLLPETAVLDRVDGRLVHVDADDTWLFELTMDVKTPDYQLAAGTRFALLPSATLGRLVADVNDRFAPRYRLSARVTQYQGKNYLVPVYYLPLSKFKNDKSPEDGGQRAEDSGPKPKSAIPNPQLGSPELAIPPEVLEQLKKQRPLRGPRRATEAQKPPVQVPAERVLVDGVGRIESSQFSVLSSRSSTVNGQRSTANSWVFLPYALGWNLSNIEYELLPCTALEEALQKQAQVLDPIRFNVAGLVTELGGKKYLLLQRAIVVYNYGNFGR
jgi:hypothetical protein